MTPEEIIDAYNVLVQDTRGYSNAEAAKVGNSQRSIGGLAEVVANPSGQTAGLANYTYNRTFRPVVESAAARLTTEGTAKALETKLMNDLLAAKQRYEDSKNKYTVAASTPQNNNPNPYNEVADFSEVTAELAEVPKEGTLIGTGWDNGVLNVNIADGKGGSTRKTVNYPGMTPGSRVVGSGWNGKQFVLNVVDANGKARLIPVNGVTGVADYGE